MKKLFLTICFFLLSASYLYSQVLFPNAIERIDSLFLSFDNSGSPGFAVGIFSDTEIIYDQGYGLSNLEYGIPITSDTRFNVASLSKQFTAACIALLIIDGKISLDDDVAKYIHNFPEFDDTIKIKHLIYMTSGLKEYYTLDRGPGLSWNPFLYFSTDTALNVALKQTELDFKPGSRWMYSNINYMLLTKIVEEVTGLTFAEFARNKLFQPIGMLNTMVNDDITSIIKNRAVSYRRRDNEGINEFNQANMKLGDTVSNGNFIQIQRNSAHFGGSGIYTSINDLFLWNKNFYSREFGGDEFYNLMHRREKFDHDKDNDAFGLVFGNYKDMQTVWYEGGDLGVSAYMVRLPLQKLTVVCLANFGNADPARYANKIIDILIDENVISK